MLNSNALDTLIDLANKATDEAAKQLGFAIRTEMEASKKLELLMQYRDEYTARCQAGLSKGLSAAGYRNFQMFLEKLDLAIEGQQKIVAENARLVIEERAHWQSKERKRMSFGTLATRLEQHETKAANRREQKQSDEFANRKTHLKR